MFPGLWKHWKVQGLASHTVPAGITPARTPTDSTCTGLRGLLFSGFLSVDYAQLLHEDPFDCGPTVVARFTDTAPDAPSAYHLVLPTLSWNGKQGLICHQERGTLTIFLASRFLHTSTLNERGPSPLYPSIGVGFVQKNKNLTVSHNRRRLLEDIVSFDILRRYETS